MTKQVNESIAHLSKLVKVVSWNQVQQSNKVAAVV